MPKHNFIFTWSAVEQKTAGIGKGYLLLKFLPLYRETLGKFMLKLDTWQEKARAAMIEKGITGSALDECLREITATFEYHFRKRTLDQNALKWALYTIEANEQNYGQSGDKEQNVTSMELYVTDLKEYGDRICITDRRKYLPAYQAEYRVIEGVILDDGREFTLQGFNRLIVPDDDMITLRVIKGTSKKDTKEMGEWIDRIFNRLAYHGVNVTQPEQIVRYWQQWREGLNDAEVILHDEIMTHADYKALNPLCEGCSTFIGLEGGEIAHIKGFGMGGDRSQESTRDHTWNILHLCHDCHMSGSTAWHLGYKTFLQSRPWLRYKVNQALHRDYAPIQEE
jgi:hypothetical protein